MLKKEKPLGRICGTTDLWHSHQSSRDGDFQLGGASPQAKSCHASRSRAFSPKLCLGNPAFRYWMLRHHRPALCSLGLQVPSQPRRWPFHFLSQECSVRCSHGGPSARGKKQTRLFKTESLYW